MDRPSAAYVLRLQQIFKPEAKVLLLRLTQDNRKGVKQINEIKYIKPE